MADIIVQPKRFNGTDNDNLIIYQAVNAANATNAENATNATKINDLEIKRNQLTGILGIDNFVIPQRRLLWSGPDSIPINQTMEFTFNISEGDKLEIVALYDGNFFKGYMEVYNNKGCTVSMTKIDTTECDIISFSVLFENSKLKIFNPCAALFGSGSGIWTLTAITNISLIEIVKVYE